MKKYKHTLEEFNGLLSVSKTIKYIRYLILLIQLELFCDYGFVHGDIHAGNVLIEKMKNLMILHFHIVVNQIILNYYYVI